MPAMSDVTVDPYHQNESDLTHIGPQGEATVWNDPAMHHESQSEGFTPADLNTLNFDSLPPLDCSTQNECSYLGPVSGGPECTSAADFSFQQDIKDPAAVPGCAGIRNLGNTCFMGSGLQCLVSNPSLITHFLVEFQPESEDVFFSSLTGQFALLLKKVWSGQYSVICPAKFKEILGVYHPQFKDYRQHDCQEFLALLMDSLHEQLNSGSPLAKTYDSEEESSQSEPEMWLKENCQLEPVTEGKLASVSANHNDVSSLSCQSEDSRLAEAILTQSLIVSDDSLQSDSSNQSHRSDTPSRCDEASQEAIKSFQMPNNLADGLQISDDNLENNMMQTPADQIGSEFIENIPTQPSPAMEQVEDVKPALEKDEQSLASDSMEVDDSREENEDGRKLPSLEDLYMKDTKTLNTNVLSCDLIEEINMAMDSEKFHKVENTSQTSEMQSQFDLEHLNDLLTIDPTKGNGSKPIKETNLLAKVKDKFPDDCYPKKFLFSEIIDDETYGFNNIKRFKMDDEEKNLKMQARMKVNTDKNPTKSMNIGNNVDMLECSVGVPLPSRARHLSSQQVAENLPNVQPAGRYLKMADKAWQKHLAQNHSIIVDAFHGQFKSTVVCSECHHVSLTFEPFMYLSVPLPHAMERQISVIFVPSDNKQPVRYLITLNKQDSVKALKHHMTVMIGEESCDMIVAEVLDNHIARILEDHTLLRYVNDSNRTIYAFEMLPAPDIDNPLDDTITCQTEAKDMFSTNNRAVKISPNNMVSSLGTSNSDIARSSKASNVDSVLQTDGLPATSTCGQASVGNNDEHGRLNNSMDHAFNQSWSSEDFRHNIDYQHNPLTGENDSSTTFDVITDNTYPGNTVDGLLSVTQAATESSMDQSGKAAEDEGGANDGPTAADQWKTCAICLEEMIDSDLMAHASCGCTLCHTCLEMTFKHYGDAGLNCPVCSTPVDPAVDFIQLNDMADYKPKTRILSVPIVHRLDTVGSDDKVKSQLFGHPNMLYLPSNMTAEFLYGSVDRVVQCLANYVVILTDGQGLHCSRCLYTQHCSGCQLPREGEISLQPGDHLAIKFTDLNEEQMECTQKVIDHESMENLRPNETLSLFECFEAFTQSEVLDEHNPWYCPVCKHNRCANKTMTVWKYPNTLVVYLKRFVFHELSSTKIDCKVAFPLEDLDLSNFISGPTKDCLKYDLQSCVCHFGGVNSGHYTSYAKHPVSGEWIYYNDENVTHKQPGDEDFSNAYILFYQRQGTTKNFKLPDKLPSLPDLPQVDTSSPSLPVSTDYISPPSFLITDCGSANTQDKEVAPPIANKPSSQNPSSNYDFYT